ncbi:MAG: CinA family protein [Candidatus Omnitrophica bacterium]|nr:CinA family protein [Candidatus Omnitrophota bacterium]
MLLKEIAKLLLKNKKTLAVAESCTGGLVSHTLTNISGSSKYFKLGLVLYSNNAKSEILKIKKEDIRRFGAVSEKTAILMAKKIKSLANTHIGLSTTGFAGPKGGNKRNPVGTVYIALAYKNSIFIEKFKFNATRTQIKNKAKNKALLLIKQCLESQ